MLGAGGGWGGGGGGPWDGMVGVVDKVEIVGVDVKLGGAVVALLRCVGGEIIVDKILVLLVFFIRESCLFSMEGLWDRSSLL